jgi:molybdate transport system substrate-binding protein
MAMSMSVDPERGEAMRKAGSVKRGLRLRAGIAALVLVIALTGGARAAAAQDILVFAAASLKNALDDAAALYQRQTGQKVTAAYAASSALARQLENGAPADIFISADRDWMDYVLRKGLIDARTRIDLLGNRLVLIAPAASPAEVDIKPGFPLRSLLGDGRLAMGDPAAVPAGKYGKAALETLGVWATVADKVAPSESVRAALAFVARRAAPFGIVYATDAAADREVRVVGVFPEDTHPPIVYPIAVTAVSRNLGAPDFVRFLGSAAAKPLFQKQGFTVLE